ncbi:MAG: hypothetical protein J3Q66DRAFT_376890 [Benniella sp.]|nr:MAG: hypothetical protein J3Q66DRAFT_376890 [Benniella sp.]
MLGFWGLTVLPNKTYSQIVENSFKLSMAALDEEVKEGRSSVRVTVDKKTFVLCSLTPGKIEQQSLDLVFTEGESITFSVSGNNSIHLSGNYLPEDDYDSEEDPFREMSDEDMYEDEDGEDEGEDADEDEDMGEDEEDNEDDNVIVTKGAKRVAKQLAPEKKQKISENQAKPVKVAKETAKAIKEEPVKKEPSKKDVAVKKEAPVKKEEIKKEIKKEEPKKDIKKEAPKKENKQVLANGLIIEDVKVGTGPAAKSGKKIGMRYIGRLTTGKVFDKNTSGKPFDFNLGRGEVIKGWDLGIQGMQVGGERRLTIPSELAYGSRGAPPDIPRNATLVFEVKLVSMK